MGQYYYPTIIRKKGNRNYSQQFYSHEFDNGLKLMEHSYIGNYFTETVIGQLYNNPGRLAWMGDYHAKGDIKNAQLDALFRRHYKTFEYDRDKKGKHYTLVTMLTHRKGRFILNHDKQVFIDMEAYEENAEADNWGCIIHPLPLLTAVGNGRGGGDYWGKLSNDLVGIWAGNLIETQDAKPNGYEDVTFKCFFKE